MTRGPRNMDPVTALLILAVGFIYLEKKNAAPSTGGSGSTQPKDAVSGSFSQASALIDTMLGLVTKIAKNAGNSGGGSGSKSPSIGGGGGGGSGGGGSSGDGTSFGGDIPQSEKDAAQAQDAKDNSTLGNDTITDGGGITPGGPDDWIGSTSDTTNDITSGDVSGSTDTSGSSGGVDTSTDTEGGDIATVDDTGVDTSGDAGFEG